MLPDAYFVAKIYFDTAENEPAKSSATFLCEKFPEVFLNFLIATSDLHAGQPRSVIPVGDGVPGWCFEHGQSILTNDPYNDPRFNPVFDKRFAGLSIRSISKQKQ